MFYGRRRGKGRTGDSFCLAAISAWKTAASAKYSYRSEPIAVKQEDGRYVVTTRITGSFPGSPIDLRYIFALGRGKIVFLEIAA